MRKGLKQYGEEDKIIVKIKLLYKMREVQAKFTNPLSF